MASTPQGGKQAWAWGDSQMDSSRFASDSWGAEPEPFSSPFPPLQTRQGAAATSRVSLPPVTPIEKYHLLPSVPGLTLRTSHRWGLWCSPMAKNLEGASRYQRRPAFFLCLENAHWPRGGRCWEEGSCAGNCLCLPTRSSQMPRPASARQRGPGDTQTPPKKLTPRGKSSHP